MRVRRRGAMPGVWKFVPLVQLRRPDPAREVRGSGIQVVAGAGVLDTMPRVAETVLLVQPSWAQPAGRHSAENPDEWGFTFRPSSGRSIARRRVLLRPGHGSL